MKYLNGPKILDVGSGPGRDSYFFKECGCNPICIDNSEEMIVLCKEKGLEAHVMDMEDMRFKEKSFDGVWAYASLLHTPKIKFDNILKNINLLLNDDGLFFIGMVGGDTEGLSESKFYGS